MCAKNYEIRLTLCQSYQQRQSGPFLLRYSVESNVLDMHDDTET